MLSKQFCQQIYLVCYNHSSRLRRKCAKNGHHIHTANRRRGRISVRCGETCKQKQYCAMSSSSASRQHNEKEQWNLQRQLPLPPQFLYEMDARNFDPQTHQRLDKNVFDLHNGKPLHTIGNESLSLLKSSSQCISSNMKNEAQSSTNRGKHTCDRRRYDIDKWYVRQGKSSAKRKIEPTPTDKKEDMIFTEPSHVTSAIDDNRNENDCKYEELVIHWTNGHCSTFSIHDIQNWENLWRTAGPDRVPPPSTSKTASHHKKFGMKSNIESPCFYPHHDGRVMWTNLTESYVRNSSELSIPFPDIIQTSNAKDLKRPRGMATSGMDRALTTLYKYGILLVTNVPCDGLGGIGGEGEESPCDHNGAGAIAALASSLSGGSDKNSSSATLLPNYRVGSYDTIVLPHGTDGPLRTLYGTVWSTSTAQQSDGSSTSDSAYGHTALPLHTDMTYHGNPPGLQIFVMVQNSACGGGQSIFTDGLAMAESLRRYNPDAFQILSKVPRRYRCIANDSGWHLQASGCVIEVDQCDKFQMVRHNDLDRLPDLPSFPIAEFSEAEASRRIEEFYQQLHDAHKMWNAIICDDQYRLTLRLNPGDAVIVANQRVMHGRLSFQSDNVLKKGRHYDANGNELARVVAGCYVSQDDLKSRWRQLGLLND